MVPICLKSTITETLLERCKSTPQEVGYRFKSLGSWHSITYAEFYEEIELTAFGLMELGVERLTKVGLLSRTQYHWTTADLAIMSCNGITVPIHHTSTAEDALYVINQAEISHLLIQGSEWWEKTASIGKSLPHLKYVIIMGGDPPEKTDSLPFEVLTLDDLREKGLARKMRSPEEMRDRIRGTHLEDPFSICYTSATTGDPKGAVLTHQSLISVLQDSVELFRDAIEPEKEELLTFLPFSHIIGRLESLGSLVFGWKLNFAENVEHLDLHLKEVKPTILFTVPRIFDRAYQQIVEALPKLSWIERKVFDVGFTTSKVLRSSLRRYPGADRIGRLVQPYYQKMILKRVSEAFGGRLRFAVCGGAPLAKETADFFYALGIMILEGYGLTETCAPVTINTLVDYRFGSVGKPLPEVEIKITEDGEILIRSRKLFTHYYGNPEETERALVDGWFHTGDVGFLDPDGYLHITDRKKDLIVLSGGKNISPQRIENRMKKTIPLIQEFVVIGDQRKHLVALVTLSPENASRIAEEASILYDTISDLSQHPKIRQKLSEEIDEVNRTLARPERIKRFLILPEPFSTESGELTVSMKVRRSRIFRKYHNEIEHLFKED
ncbi:MAG: long-chain fatty acid--CoA ligase [Proteobacteria bacterium]|nr:MAG: long-chain fatty acid--CoA ligase [Pseudomonadota bacterium]